MTRQGAWGRDTRGGAAVAALRRSVVRARAHTSRRHAPHSTLHFRTREPAGVAVSRVGRCAAERDG